MRTASTIWSRWIPSNMPAPRVGSGEAWSARFIARHGYRHPVLNELIKKKERGEGVFPPFSFFHFSIFPPSGAFSRGVCLQPYQEVPDFQLFRSRRLACGGRAERALFFFFFFARLRFISSRTPYREKSIFHIFRTAPYCSALVRTDPYRSIPIHTDPYRSAPILTDPY